MAAGIATAPMPARPLTQRIAEIVCILTTLEEVAARDERPAAVTELLLDQLYATGTMLQRIARG